MKDCWLSPYGEIIWCSGPWHHNDEAVNILIERYGFKDYFDINFKYRMLTPTDVLIQIYGWARYTTCVNIGWTPPNKLTTDQKNKMFDLTGYVEKEE